MVVHAQEIQAGVFIGNTIVSKNEPFAKFINTTNEPVFINYNQINPTIEPFDNYQILKTTKKFHQNSKEKERNDKI